ncbi:molybdate ABC transporter substrate-binding protein [Acidipila sp. EB88]|uniref:molybdate ABC transporter substrate-binding protein n=1 Tax=Acidipila sp. EB88 TaxID=2305226 RepID=UPI000F5F7FD9|nr:molybdate ABC transporter substrate-binding protein [Acidipila sp. EB88]RRA49733.1 molybdate ABC transporter substrate-binding protein [Acidipila sp. EB88]
MKTILKNQSGAGWQLAVRRAAILAAVWALCCGGSALLSAQSAHTVPVVHVAAAADLQPVLPAVLETFEHRTGIHAEATYQSSATLTQQIFNGAPFDLFLAADMSYPQRLVAAGLTNESRPVPYARGTLVLWARHDAKVLRGGPLTFAVLRHPQLQSVAIANPDHAPYGRAAKAAIATMHLASTLGPKLKVAENIAQAAQYADSGNAEVGFLSLTSASSAKLSADGTYLKVPEEFYPPIVQGAVVLHKGANAAAAEQLLHFLAAPSTRAMLASGGLQPPQ